MDLDDLLDEIKAERPATPIRAAVVRGETFSYGDALRTAKWSPADKLPSHTLELSEYERTWLVTRIQVHLKSYEHYEWSEMKDVLQSVLKRLEALAHDTRKSEISPATTMEDACRSDDTLLHERHVDPTPHVEGPGGLHSPGAQAGQFPDCSFD